MKSNILIVLFFIPVAYILPLFASGNLKLLFNFNILILIIISIILFLTQPPTTIKDIKNNNQNDKFTALAILSGSVFSQIISVLEWSILRKNNHIFDFDILTVTGILFISTGTLFRIISIKKLDKHFSTIIKVQKYQKIITTGIYGIIRHPSYSAAYLAIIGSCVFIHAYFSIFITAIIMFFIYRRRIKVEEKLLIKKFGNIYKKYQKKTFAFIPFFW